MRNWYVLRVKKRNDGKYKEKGVEKEEINMEE